MTRMTTVGEQADLLDFANEAAACFAKNETCWTFTRSGRIKPGELFAMRWGMGNDCVLVFRIDDNFEPVNFQQAITRR
jgi:hypothetical protein